MKAEAGNAILKIKDNGPGISEEQREQLFRRFYKGSNGHSESPGLGLSIVDSICEMHGFKYNIKSGAEGGTTFTITMDKVKQIREIPVKA